MKCSNPRHYISSNQAIIAVLCGRKTTRSLRRSQDDLIIYSRHVREYGCAVNIQLIVSVFKVFWNRNLGKISKMCAYY